MIRAWHPSMTNCRVLWCGTTSPTTVLCITGIVLAWIMIGCCWCRMSVGVVGVEGLTPRASIRLAQGRIESPIRPWETNANQVFRRRRCRFKPPRSGIDTFGVVRWRGVFPGSELQSQLDPGLIESTPLASEHPAIGLRTRSLLVQGMELNPRHRTYCTKSAGDALQHCGRGRLGMARRVRGILKTHSLEAPSPAAKRGDLSHKAGKGGIIRATDHDTHSSSSALDLSSAHSAMNHRFLERIA
jgi:hypothetical protein